MDGKFGWLEDGDLQQTVLAPLITAGGAIVATIVGAKFKGEWTLNLRWRSRGPTPDELRATRAALQYALERIRTALSEPWMGEDGAQVLQTARNSLADAMRSHRGTLVSTHAGKPLARPLDSLINQVDMLLSDRQQYTQFARTHRGRAGGLHNVPPDMVAEEVAIDRECVRLEDRLNHLPSEVRRDTLVPALPVVFGAAGTLATVLAVAWVGVTSWGSSRTPTDTSPGRSSIATPGPVNQLAPGPIAGLSRQAGLIDLFWIDSSGTFRTTYFDNQWNAEKSPSRLVAAGDQGSATAAIAPDADRLAIFWRRGSTGALAWAFYDPSLGWSVARDLTTVNAVRQDSPIVAVPRGGHGFSAFWADPDGAIRTMGMDDVTSNATSAVGTVASAHSAARGTNLVVLALPTGALVVLWIRPDGSVVAASSSRDRTSWTTARQIGRDADVRSGVAAAAESTGEQISVFWVRGGSIRSATDRNGRWSAEQAAAGTGIVRAGSSLAAIAAAGHVLVYWIAPNGAIHTNGNQPVADACNQPAGPRSGLIAYSHADGLVDVVWVTGGGAIVGFFHDVGTDGPCWTVAQNGSITVS